MTKTLMRWSLELIKEKFELKYLYYLVPSNEDLHMYWFINFNRGISKYHGEEYLNISPDVYEPYQEHIKMWEAWETGLTPTGYDVYDNKFGNTYAYYRPLIINNRKLGLIGVEIQVDEIKNKIFNQYITLIFNLSLIVILSIIIIVYIFYKKVIFKLKLLESAVSSYTNDKNPDVASFIEKHTQGDNELSSLSRHIALMIHELNNYIIYLKETASQLREEKDRADSLDRLAKVDALTGVGNKRSYDLVSQELTRDIAAGKAKFAIVVIDLNSLKMINDVYGHEKGNFIIKQLCKIIHDIFIHSNIYRIGGDEFTIILENQDLADYNNLIDQFNEKMNEIYSDQSLERWERVSAAIGVAYFDPTKDTTVDHVFKRADKEMYTMKKYMKALLDL